MSSAHPHSCFRFFLGCKTARLLCLRSDSCFGEKRTEKHIISSFSKWKWNCRVSRVSIFCFKLKSIARDSHMETLFFYCIDVTSCEICWSVSSQPSGWFCILCSNNCPWILNFLVMCNWIGLLHCLLQNFLGMTDGR